jgi:hypothetical protein
MTPSPHISRILDDIFGAVRPTRWVTRERPKIDRIACPWLILRFIDPRAELHYVPADRVMETARDLKAEPYDVPNVRFSHRGELCSFDAFIEDFNLGGDALKALATIVRGADTNRLDLAPQAAGLVAISLGLSRQFAEDHVMLHHGLTAYDALYTWAKGDRSEVHDWTYPPSPRRPQGVQG